jgi:hypothetical protein
MPKPDIAAQPPPASWSCWATERLGSGTSPAGTSRPPPRSSTSTTPTSTSTKEAPWSPPTSATTTRTRLAERLAELDRGDIAALLTAGRELVFPTPRRQRSKMALDYFETNASRIRYAQFRERGCFLGSGRGRGRPQSGRRPAAQTLRNALVTPRRRRHRHPAMPRDQRPVGRDLEPPPQPDRCHSPLTQAPHETQNL